MRAVCDWTKLGLGWEVLRPEGEVQEWAGALGPGFVILVVAVLVQVPHTVTEEHKAK